MGDSPGDVHSKRSMSEIPTVYLCVVGMTSDLQSPVTACSTEQSVETTALGRQSGHSYPPGLVTFQGLEEHWGLLAPFLPAPAQLSGAGPDTLELFSCASLRRPASSLHSCYKYTRSVPSLWRRKEDIN